MSQSMADRILDVMQGKTTPELLDIWRKNNRNEYSDDAFEAIRKVLSDRKVLSKSGEVMANPVTEGRTPSSGKQGRRADVAKSEPATRRCAACEDPLLPGKATFLSGMGEICESCHERDEHGDAERGDDALSGEWKAAIYASILVPFAGPWIIVVLSSALYYSWRDKQPKKAAEINIHGWIAWLLGNVVGYILYVLLTKA